MSEPRTEQGRAIKRTLERLAREDHEKNCPGDEPLETRSVIHRYVHDNAAQRSYARLFDHCEVTG